MAVSSLREQSVPPVPEGGSDDLMSDFVVLPRSPNDDCFMLEAAAGNGPLDQLKLSLPHDDRTSLSSASDDLTHQEAEERIAKVLKENVTLKEKVAQSTAKIHQQLEAFVTWQRQLQAAHQATRQELEETQRLLDEKRAAESELKGRLSRLEVSTMDTMSFCEPVPGLLPNKDRGEMSLSQVVVELHDEQSKTAMLTEKIEELTEKLAAKTAEAERSQATVGKLTNRLAEAESRSSAISAKATSRQAELETALLEKEALVRALQGQCEGKVAELEELRRALLAAEKNSERARRDYAELLRTWQEFENSNEAGERTFVRVEAPPGVRAAAAWRESEQAHRQELAEQKEQVAALRRELEELKQQAELLPPLRAQVDVFRTDYTTERNLRRELEQRVQEHLSTIEELQAHIRTLQAAETRRDGSNTTTQQQRSTENSSASTQPENAELQLACPLCMEACPNRSVYIAHVQSCADGQEVR